MKNKISWPYICGLIETDGDFYIGLTSKGQFLCEIRISQKNIDLLKDCQNFFEFCGIYSTIYVQNVLKSGRASQLRAPKQMLMSMHKTHADQNYILKYSTKLLCSDYEKRLGLKKNQSKGAAKKLLQQIDF